MKVYKVENITLASKQEEDKIVFSSIEDMEKAYKDIDNGKDIYVQTDDGLVTKLLHQMINTRIYEGTIKISAKVAEGEEKQLKE